MSKRSRSALRGGVGALGLGLGLGAALMNLFDPDSGRRRRALARDRGAHALRQGSRGLGARVRGLSQRARGDVIGLGRRLRRGAEPVPDELVRERVRAVLGHLAANPALLEVEVSGSHVTLSGPVLKREARRLLRKVRRVPGVRAVADRLERLDRFELLAGHAGAGVATAMHAPA